METCDISLGGLIEERDEQSAGPLEPAKILRVCTDVCSALDYLHTKAHLLHGDLKSYNVLIKNSFEQCKLCDFGVSLPLTADGFVDLEKNPKAHYIGTDIYSAPEVFYAPPHDISNKCDIFSFGLIVFECLTLKPVSLPIQKYFWFKISDFSISFFHLLQPHYEHLEEMSSEYDASENSINIQSKRLFNESSECKENSMDGSVCMLDEISTKESSLNGSQSESSILIKSTVATIGDDTIQDITGTTFNGTINNTTDASFDSTSANRQPMRDVSASFNSTMSSEGEYATVNKSAANMNESTETLAAWYGTRPRLPETQQFGEEYFVFCETFYVCTQGMPEERPTAGDLLTGFKNIKLDI